LQKAADPEQRWMVVLLVDQAVGDSDSEGANLDVGEEVDLPRLATGPPEMAPH